MSNASMAPDEGGLQVSAHILETQNAQQHSYLPDEAAVFLELLGKEAATSYVRFLHPITGGTGADQRGLHPLTTSHRVASGVNAYLVVGNADEATGKAGGVTDKDITSCPAVFVEWDDGAPIEEQAQRWQSLGLPEPTVSVATGGKSVHCYWTLNEPMAPAEWKPLQAALIAHCKGDPACKNPSRVMRLVGTVYCRKGTGEPLGHCSIINATARRYAPSEIRAALPQQQQKPRKTPHLPLRFNMPPRGLEAIREAAEYIPTRAGGEGTYEQDRNALCGCAAALAEVGQPEEMALDLLAHKWPSREVAAQVLDSTTTRSAASFWAIAKEHGAPIHRTTGTAPKVTSKPAAKSPDKERKGAQRLQPATVLEWLPERIGTPKLNTRTDDITADGKLLGRNTISRLYLELSDKDWTWPKEATADAVVLLAEQNAYDAVADFLNTNSATPLPMEQWERLDQHLLGICDPIAAAFLPRFLIGAVARTFEPGCDVRQSPVLVGPQWIGKTALGRILFGADAWVSGVGDLGKDSLERLHTAWGVELAELDGITRKADQEALKAFLTETCDTYRKPYDRAPERHPRRFLFWATSNGAALRDATGSSRFVCIPVDRPLPLEWAEQHRDAIWSRAVEQYRAGVQWWQCDEAERAAIADRNDDYQELDPWLDVIESMLRINPNGYVTYDELFNKLEVPVERRNTNTTRRLRQLAESVGWEYGRRRRSGVQMRGLWRKTETPSDDVPF
jgi:predicted P-loop ATPase